jgi:dimeric dUTPase (all-alpha-NTP-PPase superfamily)
MLNETQARTMLDMQTRMNEKVNLEWIKAAYPYLRAVVVEGAEAIEHHGWKWWKKQECDLEQLQMELVDIWHFTLSHILLKHNGDQEAAMQALLAMGSSDPTLEFDQKIFKIKELDTLQHLELTIGLASAGRVNLSVFEALLTDCQMGWDDLYSQYIGKNVLNFFRQDHGYKEGTYQKIWGGREDNEHLVDALSKLDVEHAEFRHQLYESLKDRYQKAT